MFNKKDSNKPVNKLTGVLYYNVIKKKKKNDFFFFFLSTLTSASRRHFVNSLFFIRIRGGDYNASSGFGLSAKTLRGQIFI